MSEHMIRKQIYIPRRQNLLLKRLAKQRGVSEAEVIRQALEQATEKTPPTLQVDDLAWEGVRHFVKERKVQYAGKGKPYKFNRAELYEERESRWLKPKGEN